MKTYKHGIVLVVLSIGILAPSARSQTAAGSWPVPPDEFKSSGIAVSTTANTLVIKSDAGGYQVFVFDKYTVKPSSIALGSAVRVLSLPTSEWGVRLATDIFVFATSADRLKDSPDAAAAAGASPSVRPDKTPSNMPASIRQLQSDIERQVKWWGVGFRAGFTMDPELLLVGVHARFGPFFNRNFSFRPNLEFAFGEVTKQFEINLNGVYRLPFTPSYGRWSAYIGAGPSLGFAHRNFTDADIDFGNFDFKGGLNILGGLEFRNGVFLEAKTTVYSSPTLRMVVGYTF